MSTVGVVDGATAPTHSSAQNAASHLIRGGRTTCGADHMHAVRGAERGQGTPEKAEVTAVRVG
eukprot:scaffold6819_cov51-Phaeocystis_antarctica.AAC.1